MELRQKSWRLHFKQNKHLLWVFALGVVCTLLGLLLLRTSLTSTAIGIVHYRDESTLYAPSDAKLVDLKVTAGDRVKAGTLLARLENRDTEFHILDTEQELAEARLALLNVELEVRELSVTGGGADFENLDQRIELLDEALEIQETLTKIKEQAAEQKIISRADALRDRLTSFDLRIQHLDVSNNKAWQARGLLDIRKERLILKRDQLQSQVAYLEKKYQMLLESLSALEIAAPHEGIVSDVYVRSLNAFVHEGTPLLKLSRENSGFEVTAYLDERNVDLVQSGMPVRLRSLVYHSGSEGYMKGSVKRIVKNISDLHPQATERSMFEVVVALESSPFPPVNGSRVEMEIILGETDWLSLLTGQVGNRRTD